MIAVRRTRAAAASNAETAEDVAQLIGLTGDQNKDLR